MTREPFVVRIWGPEEFAGHLPQVVDVYAAAMNYPHEVTQWRRGHMAAHTRRRGFRAVASLRGDRLVGFGYGYHSAVGQWWHDQVSAAVQSTTYDRWMRDAFELVELHVAPDHQGRGAGRRQLLTLLDGLTESTVVLSTPEPPPDAPLPRSWRLYRGLGFADLARRVGFCGDDRPFAILGADLPLPA